MSSRATDPTNRSRLPHRPRKQPRRRRRPRKSRPHRSPKAPAPSRRPVVRAEGVAKAVVARLRPSRRAPASRRPRRQRRPPRRSRARRCAGVVVIWAVLVAAGRGERLGEAQRRRRRSSRRASPARGAMRRLDESELMRRVVLVAPPRESGRSRRSCSPRSSRASKVTACVTGGGRTSSVCRAGVLRRGAGGDVAVILVRHRPTLPSRRGDRSHARRALEDGCDGAVPVLPVTGCREARPRRRGRRDARARRPRGRRTPQAFTAAAIRSALAADAQEIVRASARRGGAVDIRTVKAATSAESSLTRRRSRCVAAWLPRTRSSR